MSHARMARPRTQSRPCALKVLYTRLEFHLRPFLSCSLISPPLPQQGYTQLRPSQGACHLSTAAASLTPAPPAPPGVEDCVEVTAGRSSSNTKQATVSRADVTCPTEVSKDNWLGGETYDDTFVVVQSGASLSVKRSDRDGAGWGVNLRFKCCGERYPPQLLCPLLTTLRSPIKNTCSVAVCPLISIRSNMCTQILASRHVHHGHRHSKHTCDACPYSAKLCCV